MRLFRKPWIPMDTRGNMDTIVAYPHIDIDERGVARIGKTRYKVVQLAAEHYHHGWTAEELLRQHPDLSPEQVYAALAYFYDHFDRLLAQIDAAAEAAETRRLRQPWSRDLLLGRRQKAQ